MVFPNGTLDTNEEKIYKEKLIQFLKENNLSWIQAVVLLKRTYNYIRNNYNESKYWFMEKIDLKQCDIIQIEIYCPAKQLNVNECINNDLIDLYKCVNCKLKTFKYVNKL